MTRNTRWAILGVAAVCAVGATFVVRAMRPVGHAPTPDAPPAVVTPASAPPAAPAAGTVEATYKGLSSGPLRWARLTALPDGVVARAGEYTLTADAVIRLVEEGQTGTRQQREQGVFTLAEQQVTEALLAREARAWAAREGGTAQGDPVPAYVQSLAAGVTVSDAEVRAYYEANPDMVGGARFEQVQEELRTFMLQEQRQKATNDHVQTLSARTEVEVNAAWLKSRSAAALDTVVDKARRSGKPAVVDFGADGCRPCDMMAPILEELRGTYSTQCAVLFVHVRQEPILAARYGIQSIPVQVFFDKDGVEVFRHTGFYPKAQMLARMAELGVK